MSYLTIETQEKQRMSDHLVCMMCNPAMFSEETLARELEPCVYNHIKKHGAYKADRRCVNTAEYCQVFDAGAMGRGVRATRTLWANTHIGCYTGVLRAEKDQHCGDWRYNYAYGLYKYYIDASESNCMVALINHSEKEENVKVDYALHEMPDGRIECHLVFIAKRAIMRMEELFIDYGPDYWNYAKKMGITEYVLDERGNKKPKHEEDTQNEIDTLTKRTSVLRIDEYSVENTMCDDNFQEQWPSNLSPYFIKGQKQITDYMIKT